MARVRFPVGARDFSLLHSVQTGSGARPPSYPMGTRGFFPATKRLGHEVNHSPLSIAEANNGGATPLLLHMSSWLGVSLSKHRKNFS
jgi:hypothetical protein